MICMFRTYLVVQNQPSEERLSDVEAIARVLHSILAYCGTSPHLSNLYSLWECCSRTLRVFESELFPDDPLVTPGHIALPPEPKPLAALRDAAWVPHRAELRDGYVALLSLRLFLAQNFEIEMHIKRSRSLMMRSLFYKQSLRSLTLPWMALAPEATDLGQTC